jgi:hypothetical protein
MKNTLLLLTAVCMNLFTVTAQQANSKKWIDFHIESAPAWKQVNDWIQSPNNAIEVLPVDTARARFWLYSSGIDPTSTLASFICRTGGMLVDNGWIRVLGSGCVRMDRGVFDWNQDKCQFKPGNSGYLIVGDDVVGGLFAIKFTPGIRMEESPVYYFGANNLSWYPLGIDYPTFLKFCIEGNLNKFYADFRWTGWRNEIKSINVMQTISCFPLLWTKEGKDVAANRRVISMKAQWINYTPSFKLK